MSQRKNGKNLSFGGGDGVEGRVSDVETAEATGPDGCDVGRGARAEARKQPRAPTGTGGVAHRCGEKREGGFGLELAGSEAPACQWRGNVRHAVGRVLVELAEREGGKRLLGHMLINRT